ncbi:unnamed protein product [Pieris brassicae]|uniref:TIL domain-containing protein n=1 Tax=Pieris brassicae TaxID=7116 RepID=A0A9P0X735_PIEBR|nr:unnamed protein product [Pieris brassicae]
MSLKAGLLIFCIVSINAMTVDNGDALDCPANEKYVECELAVCEKYCTDLRTPIACPGLAPGCYRPACVCKDYWLRNKDGICVPYQDCGKESK